MKKQNMLEVASTTFSKKKVSSPKLRPLPSQCAFAMVSAETRTWYKKVGGGHLYYDAELVRLSEKKAILRKVDGEILEFKFSDLCSRDQEYIDDYIKKNGLVEYDGKWVSHGEKKRLFAQDQREKGLAEYDGEWITQEEKNNRQRRETEFETEQLAKGLVMGLIPRLATSNQTLEERLYEKNCRLGELSGH